MEALSNLDQAILTMMLRREQELLDYIHQHGEATCQYCHRIRFEHPHNMGRDHAFNRRI